MPRIMSRRRAAISRQRAAISRRMERSSTMIFDRWSLLTRRPGVACAWSGGSESNPRLFCRVFSPDDLEVTQYSLLYMRFMTMGSFHVKSSDDFHGPPPILLKFGALIWIDQKLTYANFFYLGQAISEIWACEKMKKWRFWGNVSFYLRSNKIFCSETGQFKFVRWSINNPESTITFNGH